MCPSLTPHPRGQLGLPGAGDRHTQGLLTQPHSCPPRTRVASAGTAPSIWALRRLSSVLCPGSWFILTGRGLQPGEHAGQGPGPAQRTGRGTVRCPGRRVAGSEPPEPTLSRLCGTPGSGRGLVLSLSFPFFLTFFFLRNRTFSPQISLKYQHRFITLSWALQGPWKPQPCPRPAPSLSSLMTSIAFFNSFTTPKHQFCLH